MSRLPRISSLPKLYWACGMLLVGSLIGCGPGAAGETAVEGVVPLSGVIAEGASELSADLASAPWQVAYHGVRKLYFPAETPASSYRERVSADGHGKFGIQVIEVMGSQLTDADFIAKQAQNEEFNYRYRGFRVLEPFLFEANYTIQLLNRDQMVAGVSCTRLLIQKRVAPLDGKATHFLVDMDPASRVVLGWQELDSHGTLLGKMEYESFALGLARNGIPMGTGSLVENELAIEDLTGPSMPFDLLHPTLLPAEYRLYKAYEVVDSAGSVWIRQVFTDGLGALIFMHKEHDLALAGMKGHSTLGVYEEGQWTVLMGEINGFALLAVGKLSSNVIQDFVSSCF